jgi:hypothetical protein
MQSELFGKSLTRPLATASASSFEAATVAGGLYSGCGGVVVALGGSGVGSAGSGVGPAGSDVGSAGSDVDSGGGGAGSAGGRVGSGGSGVGSGGSGVGSGAAPADSADPSCRAPEGLSLSCRSCSCPSCSPLTSSCDISLPPEKQPLTENATRTAQMATPASRIHLFPPWTRRELVQDEAAFFLPLPDFLGLFITHLGSWVSTIASLASALPKRAKSLDPP